MNTMTQLEILRRDILRVLKYQHPRPQSESWMTRQLDGVPLAEQRAATAQLETEGLIQITQRPGAKPYRVLVLTEKGGNPMKWRL